MITVLFVKRIASVSAGVALVFGGLVATAPAATASPEVCTMYVLANAPGTDVGVVESACWEGSSGGQPTFLACYRLLRTEYVLPVVARDACRLAAE